MQLIYLSLFALANAQLSEIPPRFSKLHHGKRNSLSTDGTCGVWRGIDTEVKCPRNNCCSVNGYCGMTNDYCGTGCQAKYGNCRGGWNPNPTPTPYETVTISLLPLISQQQPQ
ncbi:hypothetical protein BC833DRAFT_626740 [Globomyces pollinis-pini]|nr:hypothetical protein BC833DRAFT_626740 [Globomyces pollinis-pini]